MGMFDDVICDHPLPDGYVGKFQTQDLENLMDVYRITREGRLLVADYALEPVEKPGLGFRVFNRIELGEHDTNYHGDLLFYDWLSDLSTMLEYRARFTEGQLQWIKRVSPPLFETPADAAS